MNAVKNSLADDIRQQRWDEKQLALTLQQAFNEHHRYEVATGKPDPQWPAWYAKYILTH